MDKSVLSQPPLMIVILLVLLSPDSLYAVPRTEVVENTCGNTFVQNQTLFLSNFIPAMENIAAEMATSGHGVAIRGSGPDNVHALAQCYGDLSRVDCVLCYAQIRGVYPLCFPRESGSIYLDGCFMRTNNYSFFEEYTSPYDHAVCGNTTQRSSTFDTFTRNAVSNAVLAAPLNNGYARVEVPARNNDSVYILANCWSTISVSSCRSCLDNASASILRCLPWSEGRALNTGCFMRYSDTNFLNPIPGSGSSRGKRGMIIGIVAAAVSASVVLVIVIVIGVYIRKRKIIQKKRKGNADELVITLSDSRLNFKYSTLEKATNSFDEANKLGEGGFGTVYKGVLQDEREIAVKRLFLNNKHRAADFYNEVNIISSVSHKNLVRLLGCSCSGPESLLVYELLPNLSLDRFIFDSRQGKELKWDKRFEIIIGTAEGLIYLHENTTTRIIHRDIKASNILLDFRFRAKIADFGLARSFLEDRSHVSTAIVGTLGYMAPEYLTHGKLSEKVDVYSFGVLLLEITMGRQNNRTTLDYTDSLLTTAWKHFQKGAVEDLIDSNLMLDNYKDKSVKGEILRVVHVALLCTQENPSLRPSLSKVLKMMMLNKERLPTPTKPPFIEEKTMELNHVGEITSMLQGYNRVDSIANVSHSIFYPR